MKRFFPFLVLVLFAFSAVAEDLGELAKKEKARREALAKQGKKAKTLTNADIANIKSELSIQTTTPPATGTEAAAIEPPATEAAAEAPAEGSAAAELERLQSEKERLENQKDEIKENIGEGGLFFGASVGTQYQQVRETEKKIKKTEEKIQEEEKKAEEEKDDQN